MPSTSASATPSWSRSTSSTRVIFEKLTNGFSKRGRRFSAMAPLCWDDGTRSGGTGVGIGVGEGAGFAAADLAAGATTGAAPDRGGDGREPHPRPVERALRTAAGDRRCEEFTRLRGRRRACATLSAAMRVFDCHVHVQPWEQMQLRPAPSWPRDARDLAGDPAGPLRPGGAASPDGPRGRRARRPHQLRGARGHGLRSPRPTTGSRATSAGTKTASSRSAPCTRATPPTPGPRRAASSTTSASGCSRSIRPTSSSRPTPTGEGLEGLGAVYAEAERAGRPVMIHTGTSIFPGRAQPLRRSDGGRRRRRRLSRG